MLPQKHFLLGLIVSFVLYFEFEVSALMCFVFLIATVGIDVDHYLYYVYKKKDWSLRLAVGWFMDKKRILDKMEIRQRREFYHGFCFLHGVEVLLLAGLLGYFVWDLFYFVMLGFLFHLILDYSVVYKERGRFDKFSIVYDYFKYKKLAFIEEFEGIEKMVKKSF